AGAQYIVMSQAFDNARNGTNPYAINPTQETTPAVSNSGGTNYHYFIVDTSSPTATVTVPNTASTNNLPTVSGTAADTSPGQLALVKVAYRDTSVNKWWDPVAKTFTLGGAGAPPSNAFVSTVPASGAWAFTGVSTPTWQNNITYQIFAEA